MYVLVNRGTNTGDGIQTSLHTHVELVPHVYTMYMYNICILSVITLSLRDG